MTLVIASAFAALTGVWIALALAEAEGSNKHDTNY